MDKQTGQFLAEIIHSIDVDDLPLITAAGLTKLFGFDMYAVIEHPRNGPSTVVGENFGTGAGAAVALYAAMTSAINPVCAVAAGGGRPGVYDARAYRIDPARLGSQLPAAAEIDEDEDLGYRTRGWPRRLEEKLLFIDLPVATLEIGLYRSQQPSRVNGQLPRLLALFPVLSAALMTWQRRRDKTSAMLSCQARLQLTAREGQVAELIVAGCSSLAIAARLGLALTTVKAHRRNIYRKLEISSLNELHRWWTWRPAP